MASTYDPTLATPRDHVRFLIGDTNTPNTELKDEEIDGMLALYPLPHCAAYHAVESLIARNNATSAVSGPIASKSVDGISVSYATASKGMTRGDLLTRLREECAKKGRKSIFNVYKA